MHSHRDGIPMPTSQTADDDDIDNPNSAVETIEKEDAHEEETWSSYNLQIYASRKGPPLGTLLFNELEAKAREKLKDHPNAFLYVYGSAGQGAANDANVRELSKWMLVPRMLRDARVRNIRTTLFGVTHKSPLILAPIGVQGVMHPDGDIATARAAAKCNVAYTMSSASTRTIEQVGEACGSNIRWFQLYWPDQDDITLSLLNRAKTSGFTTLVVTLDTPTIGYRPHDLAKAYLPFIHGWGSQVGLSDPIFMNKFNEPIRTDPPTFPYEPEKLDRLIREGDEKMVRTMKLAVEWQKVMASGRFRTWKDLKFLKDNWDGSIVLKGIMSVKDAELALEYGMDGIVVSNHGGRQVEGSVPAFWALRQICNSLKIRKAQKSGNFTVIFDSGIRTGSDILKAIASGAQGVMLGRPFMYGLAAGGEEGVEQVIRSILADCELTMGLAGFKNLEELRTEGELVRIDDTHLSEPRSFARSRL